MNDTHTFLTKLGGLGAAAFINHWVGSLDIQGVAYDPSIDPAHETFRGPVIVVCWHEYILPLLYLRGRSNSAILTSRHRDADILAAALRHLGYSTVRGSTSRGGSRAVLKLLRDSQRSNIGIAGDGPLGPRRELAAGAIYLSSRLQVPIVVYGVGYHRPWRMPTWDRFAVPQWGSRARIITGPRMQIPPKVDRDQLEHYRQQVQAVMHRLTDEAEAWAEAGTRKVGQHVLRAEPAAHPFRRLAPPVMLSAKRDAVSFVRPSRAA